MSYFNYLIFFDPSKSHYLLRPKGSFSREKEIGNFSFMGDLRFVIRLAAEH